MPRPTEIEHNRRRNILTIRWDDGVASEYPLAYVRAWCPCATCQGHGTVVRRQAVADDIRATAMAEVGAYALSIRFSDGHDTGIYTWAWLRRIAPESEPRGLKQGEFDGTSFSRIDDGSPPRRRN